MDKKNKNLLSKDKKKNIDDTGKEVRRESKFNLFIWPIGYDISV